MTPDYNTIVQGLRDLADFLEQHPEAIPSFRGGRMHVFTGYMDSRPEFQRFMGALEPMGFERETTGSSLTLVKTFGPIRYEVSLWRREVSQPVREGWPEPITEEKAA